MVTAALPTLVLAWVFACSSSSRRPRCASFYSHSRRARVRPVLWGNRAAEGAPYLSVGLGAEPKFFVGPKFESESPKAGKSGASVDAEERGESAKGRPGCQGRRPGGAYAAWRVGSGGGDVAR